MTAPPEAAAATIELACRELKMPGLRTGYPAIARDAASQGQHYGAFLAACLACEIASRRQHRLASHLAQARFPALKTLDTFDFTAVPALPKATVLALADGAFIRDRQNVICLGGPGVGKTHVATAVGVACIQAGYRVRFTTAVTLSQELLLAQQEFRLPRYLKSWHRVDLVVLDEFGYLGLGPGGPLLFQFCADRYERGSLILTTNLDFSRWVEVLGDAALTAALLDRLTHHAHILVFHSDESYRFRESRSRLQEVAVAPTEAPTATPGGPFPGDHTTTTPPTTEN
jgi:DNA replication protein DnaC